MKTPAVLLNVILSGLLIAGCETNPDNTNNSRVTGRLTHVSGCKSHASTIPKASLSNSNLTSPSSCLQYTYDKLTNRLTLRHINAAFNCCPDTITCEVKQNGSTIEILEKEASALCNCSCLYDLDMVIDGLFEIRYLIRLTEPYAGSQEPLIFTIDLKQKPSGELCVARDGYPWGM